MARIGINHEDPLKDLIKEAIGKKLVTAIEIIPDHYAFRRTTELMELLTFYGVPYAFHFIDNSLGSADFIENNDLVASAKMIRQLNPSHVSDHLNFCRSGKIDMRQNIAAPRTEDMVELFVGNIRCMRRQIGMRRTMMIENIACHWDYECSTIAPAEFYRRVVVESGAHFLLDVHNLYCDEQNSGADAVAFIESLPAQLIREIHVSGGSWTKTGKTYMDSHDSATPNRVFELLECVLRRADPDLIVFERRSLGVPADLSKEIPQDLTSINEINRRWTKKRGKSSKTHSLVG